jgi:uncharacterized membrane protein (UPF0127 family)
MMQIIFKGKMIAKDVSIADNFISRLMGYMFQSVPHKNGILFEPAISIHTFFMNFPLDVIFMDGSYKIIKIYRNLKPWRHTWFYFNSRKTLELPAGQLPLDIKEGDTLEVQHV